MIPQHLVFRKPDVDAADAPFLQILLHGLRPADEGKQEVARVVVALLNGHAQQFL